MEPLHHSASLLYVSTEVTELGSPVFFLIAHDDILKLGLESQSPESVEIEAAEVKIVLTFCPEYYMSHNAKIISLNIKCPMAAWLNIIEGITGAA